MDGETHFRPLDPAKFRDPLVTATGDRRASVGLTALTTLWFNTGTLCNITCENCYIESSPRNDRLAYLTATEVARFLDEVAAEHLPTREIGFTGGEPFMNPELPAMLEDALARGFRTLVLTNAMKPMMHRRQALLDLQARFGDRLVLRVSIDHHTAALHERERGVGSWAPAIAGLKFLVEHGIATHVAGRLRWGEAEPAARDGYAALFAALGLALDARDPAVLVLFPEMDARADVPEITTACWGILKKSPDAVMCASSRMVVRRRGAERAVVLSCTLLPYDSAFEMGTTLVEASGAVPLNHPHCAKFCVLGGASCSP